VNAADKTTTKVKFINGDLELIKEKAKIQNRPFFVDFTASWCMPCRWMDETTFNDQKLADYIDQEYLAAKVDIDDFDGYNYKMQYNIELLPSILIFSPEGKVLARYNETMAPSTMLSILKKYDTYQSQSETKKEKVKEETTINRPQQH